MADQPNPQPLIETHGGEVKLTTPITETQGGENNPNRASAELQQAVNTFQQHGHLMTFSQLLKILASVQVKILIAIVSILITLAGVTFKLGQTFPNFARAVAQPTPLPLQPGEPPDNLFVDTAKYAFNESPPWIEGLHLHLAGEKITRNGLSEGPTIVRVETKPFAQATVPFTIKASSPYGTDLWGYPFLCHPMQNRTLYEALEPKLESDGFSIKIPKTEGGDSLLILVRLRLDNAPGDLRDLLNLRTQK